MKRKSILLIVLFMAIGFAAVSTTLYINGSSKINPNQEDFDVYYSDAYVNGTQDKSIITSDTVIEFETEFNAVGEEYILDYEVKNGSKNYDAELEMNCISNSEYLTIVNSFDTDTILESQSKREGTLTVTQTKSYVGEGLEVTIECTINANAIERTSLGISNRNQVKIIALDENNSNIKASAYEVLGEEKDTLITYLNPTGLTEGNIIHIIEITSDKIDEISSATINLRNVAVLNEEIAVVYYDEEKEEWNFIDSGYINEESELVLENNYIIPFAINNNEVLEQLCNTLAGTKWTYSYKNSAQEFTAPCKGLYKIELWGAQGGNTTYSGFAGTGGKGAYTTGDIILEENKNLFLYVGSKGSDGINSRATTLIAGGYNGGGSNGSKDAASAAGGGATDIRLISGAWNSTDSLRSRIMVAGAGGGSGIKNVGAPGGAGAATTLTGKLYGYNGTQTSGGAKGTGATHDSNGTSGGFGYGGNGGYYLTGAGGSGYYGGGGGNHVTPSSSGGGGGGSSFISGHSGCNAINSTGTHTGQPNHYSGYVFTNTKMIIGNASMPTYDGTSTMTGNAGNGYAKITFISIR